VHSGLPPNLLVGTSSWSSTDWCGSFYPDRIEPGGMIRAYSGKLHTVEIDSTWYRMPSPKMVEGWRSKTPEGFIFSAKVPRVISHDKYLEGCETDLNGFVSVMSGLGEKLGPMILQFPYVAKGKDPQEYRTGADFIRRLKGFVNLLPGGFKWGIEIRNSLWVQPPLLDVLRGRGISLVFIDENHSCRAHHLSFTGFLRSAIAAKTAVADWSVRPRSGWRRYETSHRTHPVTSPKIPKLLHYLFTINNIYVNYCI